MSNNERKKEIKMRRKEGRKAKRDSSEGIAGRCKRREGT
jgi:hypothetical protein